MTNDSAPERRLVLTSRLRFREPRQRYQSGGGWISRAQVQGESAEHREASRAWDRAVTEEAYLLDLLPEGYEWTGADPFTVTSGDIIIRIEARMDNGE